MGVRHLFRMIFQEKKDLLELYNALNDSSYRDPDELAITTLQDVIFLGMKNDLSFLIGVQLNLYEHQSTWNENMPLRGLFYFSDMLRGFVEDNDLNIYADILRRNRAEVIDLFLTTYDAKRHKKAIEEEAREAGYAAGHAEGRTEGLAVGYAQSCCELGVAKEKVKQKLKLY